MLRSLSAAFCTTTQNPQKKPKLHDYGNTPLHKTLSERNVNYQTIDDLINTYGYEEVKQMSITSNDFGYIPYHVIDNNNTICEQLMPMMVEASRSTPLNQLVNIEQLTTQYQANGNAELLQNLLISAYIINEVRQYFTESATHPQLNDTPELIAPLLKTIRAIRSDKPYTFWDDINQLNQMANQFIAAKKGNCYEYSIVSFCLIQRKQLPINAEVFQIANGDHVFLGIGREEQSFAFDPTCWGKSAVICDAWRGEAFPACEAYTKLHNYALIDNRNILITYNPNAYYLERRGGYYSAKHLSKPLSAQAIHRLFKPAPKKNDKTQSKQQRKNARRKNSLN